MTKVKFAHKLTKVAKRYIPKREPMRVGTGYVEFINFNDALDFKTFLRNFGEKAIIQLKINKK